MFLKMNYMMDNYQTSDILIYKVLKNSDDDFLNHFSIVFPRDDFINQESNMIFVANVDNEYINQTIDGSVEYKALTEFFIKTKQKDYVKASNILKKTVSVIYDVLCGDDVLKKRKIIFRKNSADYGNNLVLRGRHLLIQTTEHHLKNNENDKVKCIKNQL